MKITYKLSIGCGLGFLLALLSGGCQGTQQSPQRIAERPPNLVLILVDDLGYADVGFNGCQDIPTPNIDRIAKEGVIFSNGYVSYPVCGPSRAGLITGRYQDRFGFGRNPLFAPNDPNMGLPLSEETLADVLGQTGYKSVAIGKWHLGAHPSQRPLKRGFNDFFGFLTGGHRYFPEEWTLADEYEVTQQYAAYRTKLLRNNQRIEETAYLTDALSREAAAYIHAYQHDPFFLYLAYNAPHAPLQASDKYLDRFSHISDKKRKIYAAMISAVDDGVGLVLDQLEVLELADNTIVVFLSDNGGPEHVNASDNGPLRGKKGDVFEGGIRVPFAMRYPKKIPAGTVFDFPIISLDIFGTMVGENAGKIQLKHRIDGVNLLPYIAGKQTGTPHDALFWRKYDQQRVALRAGRNKYIQVRGKRMLFDLQADIGETGNVVNAQQTLAKELEEQQQAWQRELTDPIFMGLLEDSLYTVMHPDRFARPSDH
ncbi:MAG: sulfatase-like hydrolase/transferase [Bacteroidota bacterium]